MKSWIRVILKEEAVHDAIVEKMLAVLQGIVERRPRTSLSNPLLIRQALEKGHPRQRKFIGIFGLGW